MARTGNGHMVQEYYIERVREIRRTRKARLEGLKNRRQALAYQRDVRNAIQQAVGPNPPKTALRASITGVIERRGFRIEKISYESRPGCLVTANLYVPDSAMDHGPAVVGSCGHDAKGKQADIYQAFCQRLVRSGFVTMIIDPFNQGERDQYFRLKDREIVASCTHAHNMMGKQLQLMGDWFGAWRNWDAIRALDYLQTRPEVDPYRIGITGNSGGGTETAWTWGAEDRFAFAAPSCFVTTFLHNLENEIPADAEQYPPGVIGHGLEMVDFLIAQAPKPAMILGQNFCFFDRRGVKEAYEDLRSFYRVLGAPPSKRRLVHRARGSRVFRSQPEGDAPFLLRPQSPQAISRGTQTVPHPGPERHATRRSRRSRRHPHLRTEWSARSGPPFEAEASEGTRSDERAKEGADTSETIRHPSLQNVARRHRKSIAGRQVRDRDRARYPGDPAQSHGHATHPHARCGA